MPSTRIAVLEADAHQAALMVRTLTHPTITIELFDQVEELQRVLMLGTFNLLILEWRPGGVDSLALLGWLRDDMRDTTPVLVLSPHGGAEDVALALDLGADDYVVKPFRAVELAARVGRLLARRPPSLLARA